MVAGIGNILKGMTLKIGKKLVSKCKRRASLIAESN
jgi:hypothetical protein